MHTKDKLAQELKLVGLTELADKAATGYFDDYLSPLAFPISALMEALHAHRSEPPVQALMKRVRDGEFDGTPEDAENWFKGPEGQDAVRSLFAKPRP